MSMPPYNPADPFEAPTTETKTYTGVCHCQATKLTITVPSLDSVETCNCTYCISKDILWLAGPSDQFKFERKGPMTTYEFANKKMSFNFCSICGIFIHYIMKSTGDIKINARLLENVDFYALKRDLQFDFSADAVHAPPASTAPPFKGNNKDGKKPYLGWCHCRAVTIFLETKPFPEQRIIQCNCSWCVRWAAVHWHPPKTYEIHIGGWENMGEYKSEKAGWLSHFCKTCGDQFVISKRGPEEVALDENGQPFDDPKAALGYEGKVYCVNVRIFQDTDWARNEIRKWSGRDYGQPFKIK